MRIVSAPPSKLAGFTAPLHATTRDETIRQRLLFVRGDSVDTLQIAESLRRIRKMRFLSGASIRASCASDARSVDFLVATRDGWSMQPQVKVGGPSDAVVGITESNVLGTGRSARVYVRTDHGQTAAGASYSDPGVLGSSIAASVTRDAYRDGTSWAAGARTRDADGFAPNHLLARVRRSSHSSLSTGPFGVTGDTVFRVSAELLFARRVRQSGTGADFLQFGLEGQRTRVAAGAYRALVGPAAVRRSFVGLDVGVQRQTLAYAAAPWLSPPAARQDSLLANAAEVPVGWTADAIVGLGGDVATRQPAGHIDLWAGRVWSLGNAASAVGPRALVSTDLWTSGFRSLGRRQGEWSAASIRSALGITLPAPRGLWTAEISGEHLINPDPDTRGLTMSDPVLRAIPAVNRLAESAVSGSIDRAVYLVPAPGKYMFGLSLFAAGSMRWDPARQASSTLGDDRSAKFALRPEIAGVGGENLYVGSVGVGLLLTPLHFGRSTVRFDVGYPVLRSPQLSRQPYLAFRIVPAFGTARSRTGTP